MSSRNCQRLAPATKKMVKAVIVRTPVVPRSGSLSTSRMTGPAMSRNGSVPAAMLLILVPRVAIQWAR